MTLAQAAAHVRSTPGGIAGVESAYFAYHASPTEGGHYFVDKPGAPDYRHRGCRWCGRTRWQVRHESAHPVCVDRPDTAAIVTDEEARYLRLLERAPAIIARVCGDETPTPAQVAYLHDTHGIPPELV